MSSYIQANTNGRLHPASEPAISPLNRGFLYGDAIYEVWRTYDRVIFAWEEHWRRLEGSARALYLELPFTAGDILAEIKRTVAAFRVAAPAVRDVYIRLQVTRGGGAIGLDTALADRADFVLLVQENKLFTEEKFQAGLRLSLARGLHRNSPAALNPAWKTGNYLNNILCLREARQRGADEVVITNLEGEVTEAAVSNIAFVRGTEVVTPAVDAGILIGITRSLLIEKIAPRLGVRVREEKIQPRDFAGFDECFLLSTTKDLTPVAAIDANTFKLGVGTLTLRLKRAFLDYAAEESKAHPERKV
jgi:branched-chain amino acid aminotransferase